MLLAHFAEKARADAEQAVAEWNKEHPEQAEPLLEEDTMLFEVAFHCACEKDLVQLAELVVTNHPAFDFKRRPKFLLHYAAMHDAENMTKWLIGELEKKFFNVHVTFFFFCSSWFRQS